MGNPTLRSLLVCGSTSVLQRVKGNDKTPLAAPVFRYVPPLALVSSAQIILAILLASAIATT
ncbi:hypothetical protein SAMCFNEI73_pB0173 (plasmid) [Sinorhizobium americanum]|uniref:Transmembrane protein n=1 Tax=Sinorhizobium americanum TaxID=194963 RepID=A0A1L3LTE5_9HYPH|nr:hypothetical protein SAMCFNEI73_pB0173 [Sinorhizobium americanum]